MPGLLLCSVMANTKDFGSFNASSILATTTIIIKFHIMKMFKTYKKVKDIFNQEWVSEFFDVHKINNLLDDHYHKIKNNGRKIYTIYAFLIWYKDYFVDNIYLSK